MRKQTSSQVNLMRDHITYYKRPSTPCVSSYNSSSLNNQHITSRTHSHPQHPHKPIQLRLPSSINLYAIMDFSIDYYVYLGVPETATDAEIRANYKKLAFMYHPDKNLYENKESVTRRFQKVGTAHLSVT